MGLRSPIGWLLLVALGCDDGAAVPFKLSSRLPSDAPEQREGEAHEPSAGERGQSYDEGTQRITLEGRELALAQGGVRAALALDLDDDEERELLAVVQRDDGVLELVRSQAAQGGAEWETPAVVNALEVREGCALESVALRALETGYGLADGMFSCASKDAYAAQPGAVPEDAQERQPQQHVWLYTVERVPRLLEHLTLLSPDKAPGVDWSFTPADLDQDGHQDVTLALVVQATEGAAERIELELLNRPSGLARDAEEPEATLLSLANRAKQNRKSKPGLALALAERALALHAAICREAERPVIALGGVRGLPCGSSLGAGRAASVRVAVLAAQGRLFDALEQQHALRSQRVYRLSDNDRDRLRYAFEGLIDKASFRWQRGPRVAQGALPPVHRPAIAFLDEHRVLLRGPTPLSFDTRTGLATPVGIAADRILRDPSGRLAIVDLFRSCEGYHLAIVPATQVVAGVVAGKPTAQPLIEPKEAPPGARCPVALPPSLRADRGDYRVLDWTTAGVLLARGRELELLSLDEQGNASAAARSLAPSATLPDIEQPDALTPNGKVHALSTALGLAILDRETGKARLIAPPQGAGEVRDIALSPSGKRLAIVAGQQLFLGQPAPLHGAAPPRPAPDAP